MNPVIYLDIENTLIDSLDNPVFLNDNCESIKAFIKAKDPSHVNIFTWGWKTKKDIEPKLVEALFNRLDIPEDKQGKVVTKETSVDEAITMGWLNKEDREEALIPGMMTEYGISKITCFLPLASIGCIKNNCEVILIDDLVDKFEEVKYSRGMVTLYNPRGLGYYNLPEAWNK